MLFPKQRGTQGTIPGKKYDRVKIRYVEFSLAVALQHNRKSVFQLSSETQLDFLDMSKIDMTFHHKSPKLFH